MEQAALNRHDMLYLTDEALRIAASQYTCVSHESCTQSIIDGIFRPAKTSIPAIVARQTNILPGQIAIGFVWHQKIDGLRVRIGTMAPRSGILAVLSPFDVAKMVRERAPQDFAILHDILGLAQKHKLEAGFFGSFAMQVITGFPYTTKESDVDILIKGSLENAGRFYSAITEWSDKNGVAADVELRLPNGPDIKLAELHAGKKTVLGKTLSDIILLQSAQLYKYGS